MPRHFKIYQWMTEMMTGYVYKTINLRSPKNSLGTIYLTKCVTEWQKTFRTGHDYQFIFIKLLLAFRYERQESRSTRQMQRSQDAAKAGHPQDTKPKPGVDTRAAKGEGHVMCEIK
jgi:hypothetical protein